MRCDGHVKHGEKQEPVQDIAVRSVRDVDTGRGERGVICGLTFLKKNIKQRYKEKLSPTHSPSAPS